jgi:hypothetical protein
MTPKKAPARENNPNTSASPTQTSPKRTSSAKSAAFGCTVLARKS